MKISKDNVIFFLLGLIIGMLVTAVSGVALYKFLKSQKQLTRYEEPVKNFGKKILAGPPGQTKDFYLSFEKQVDLEFFQPEGSIVELSQANATVGKHSLMVRIEPGLEYPGLLWEVSGSKIMDWRKANDFHFDVYNNNEDNISLIVKFKSGKAYPKKSYSYQVNLEPLKMNTISIPMDTISSFCDVSQISYFKFFVPSPQKEILLYFDNIGIRNAGKDDEKSDLNNESVFDRDKQANTDFKEKEEIIVASSLDRIFQDGRTLVKPSFSDKADIQLAKNEYESFQVVVKNGKERLKDTHLEIELPGGKIKAVWRVVGYVPTKKPYYPVKFVGLWPDPLLPSANIDIEPGITQPFWVTLYAPDSVTAGVYQGKFKVISGEQIIKEIPITIKVADFKLPLDSHLKTAFDFYPHVTSSRYPRGENESESIYGSRINELNELFIINMIKHRMNPILNIDPASQAQLDKVARYKKYGLSNFSIGKRGGTFDNNWPSSEEEIEKLFQLYRGYGETLKFNNMLQDTYIYTWDESKLHDPQVAKICSMIHRAYPGLKNMVCYHGFWDIEKYPDWGKDIDIWCFGIGDYNEAKVNRLRVRGMEMWMYISGPGGSGEPNLAIDFDSIDYRIIPWLCWKYDLKGFLYWSVNWWPFVDPFKSAANTKWEQNGNGLLFYPGQNGPVDSLRAEIYRDGMEDYEYLWLLKQRIDEAKIKGNNDLIKQAEALVTVDKLIVDNMRHFTKDTKMLMKRRKDIADMIEKLGDNLGKNEQEIPVLISEEMDKLQVTQDFSETEVKVNDKNLGEYGQLTFELYRGGSFTIDKKSGFLWQKSDNYGDVAIVRSTNPLPKTYKISVVVGEIDYGLDKIKYKENDPAYKEGPMNENGCYLLAITDEVPVGHHTNDWWHQHRKVCIDVDNNVMGNGMPNPIFMVYFDKDNQLHSWNGMLNSWDKNWEKAVEYKYEKWYRVEIEKTEKEFIMSIFDEKDNLLKKGTVTLDNVWHEDGNYPDYLVIGDPHENYYQGSMKIRSISMPVEVNGQKNSGMGKL